MDLTEALAACPVVAILRGIQPEEAEAVGEALVGAGVRIIEVPLNSPRSLDSIGILARRFGTEALVGAGTVLRLESVGEVAAAGGRLIVTPHAAPGVVQLAKLAGLVAVPGFFTPAEAFALLEAGADALKLFPAEAANPAVLRAVLAVLPPGTPVLPVGGIGAGNMAEWRAAGAAGFGVGSSVYKPGDTADVVARKAGDLVAALARLRTP